MSEVTRVSWDGARTHYKLTDDGAEVAVTVENGGNDAYLETQPTIFETGTPPARHIKTEVYPPIYDQPELVEFIGRFATQAIKEER